MKKIISCLLTVTLIVTLSACQSAGNHEANDTVTPVGTDEEFIDTLSRVVMERYKLASDEHELKICIDYELNELKEFKDKYFEDSSLQDLALSYIEGVEEQKAALGEKNKINRQNLHYLGMSHRYAALKKLTDNYDFLKDNDEYIAVYYNQAEKAEEDYNAVDRIQDDLIAQLDGVNSTYVNDSTQRLKIKNNTEYTYDLRMYFTYYDDNDNTLDSGTEYYENITPGQKRNLDFYYPADGRRFNWDFEIVLD